MRTTKVGEEGWSQGASKGRKRDDRGEARVRTIERVRQDEDSRVEEILD